jgi:hypothetical protein
MRIHSCSVSISGCHDLIRLGHSAINRVVEAGDGCGDRAASGARGGNTAQSINLSVEARVSGAWDRQQVEALVWKLLD